MRMVTIAAGSDTWGISGPDFLRIYVGAIALAVVAAIVLRLLATRENSATPIQPPTPAEVAYLHGGAERAVYSSLAGLRAVGVVDVGNLKELVVTGPAPVGLTRLDHAVYEAAGRHVQASRLAEEAGVRSALTTLDDDVRRAGWLLDGDARAKLRLGSYLVLAVVVLGVVRMGAGLANDKPVATLLLLVILAVVAWLLLRRVPRLSGSGKRAIGSARTANPHLSPQQAPAWSTYGLTGAAMGVALYGTAALWAADPAFASAAGLRQQSGGGGDSSYSGYSGGDSCGGGGGDGGGGGGGCGGGGCGG